MTTQFSDMKLSSIFFEIVVFLLSRSVTGPSVMSISYLVLELWRFSFTKDWLEIWQSEVIPSEFCPIYVDWDKLGIPAFAVSELLRENLKGKIGGLKFPYPYPD